MNTINAEEVNRVFAAYKNQKRYIRDILMQVHQTPTLETMIVQTNPIDYTVIFWQDDENALKSIAKARVELGELWKIKDKTKELKKKIEELEKLLYKLEPSEEIQDIIMIEELLRYSDEWDLGIGIEPDSEMPYIYNSYYWVSISKPLTKEFLSAVATKTGRNYYDMRVEKVVNKLYDQFASLCTLVPDLNEKKDEVKINLQNGTFVISKDKQELRNFDKRDFFKYQLPFKYDENATCEKFQAFLDEVLPEQESQMILAEYLGYIFTTNLKLEKCLILKGEGSNGKSVIFEIVQALLGEENICSYTISNLCNENGYFRAQLSNMLLNYSSELGGKNINPDLFKKLISNEPVDARSPYGHPFILRNYGKFMFNTNKFPNNIEFTHAYLRRFIILSFDVVIPEERQDKDLAKRIISTELSGIFNWVLEGLKRLLKQQRFTESLKAKEVLEEMRYVSDSVAQFIQDKDHQPSKTDENPMLYKQFYTAYTDYCKLEGLMSVSKKEFGSRLKSLGFIIDRYGGGGQCHIFLKKNPVYKAIEDTFNIKENEALD